ncbi:MAG: hypothetical protein KF886_01225 [Candidatus Hydrogenedentes bacterium]|nr:hypothetical protein [Candidatus Hydrogenedentota bacterium]
MNAHYWQPTFVFDEEPDWKRLGELHPDVYICGFSHREGHYWYSLMGINDLPPEYRDLEIPWSWPDNFEAPDTLIIPQDCADFIEKAGKAGLIARAVLTGQLKLGVAVSLLAGVRTFVFEAAEDRDSMNMACVLNRGAVEGFGAASGNLELWWEEANIAVRWLPAADSMDPELDRQHLERLRALPFVRVETAGGDETKATDWPRSVWPETWADAGELMGIGLNPPSFDWDKNWRDCYWKPAPNEPSALSELFWRSFGCRFSGTWLGKVLTSRKNPSPKLR